MAAVQHFEPVWIWERPGSRPAIGSVRAAAEWLLFFWPEAFTDGKADVAAAREASGRRRGGWHLGGRNREASGTAEAKADLGESAHLVEDGAKATIVLDHDVDGEVNDLRGVICRRSRPGRGLVI